MTPHDLERAYYRSGDSLRAKHELTRAHSRRDFPRWALGLAPVPRTAPVLDAGCGWGRFTWTLIDRFAHQPGAIACADRSPGMVCSVQGEAARRRQPVRACAAGIEALPFAARTFDLVIAAHVLYHLSDIPAGLRELSRVMRPGARLLATTNSDAIRPLVIEMHERALAALDIPFDPEGPSTFSLENAQACLQACFADVQRHDFADTATYESAADFRALYCTLGRNHDTMERKDLSAEVKQRLAPTFERLAAGIAAHEGVLRTPILMGAFVCARPR